MCIMHMVTPSNKGSFNVGGVASHTVKNEHKTLSVRTTCNVVLFEKSTLLITLKIGSSKAFKTMCTLPPKLLRITLYNRPRAFDDAKISYIAFLNFGYHLIKKHESPLMNNFIKPTVIFLSKKLHTEMLLFLM